MPYSISDLRRFGFVGFVPLSTWTKSDVIGTGDDVEGIYAIVRESTATPTFTDDVRPVPHRLARTAAEATELWVENCQLLYFGKAPLRKPSKSGKRKGLAQRIDEYRRHGLAGGSNHHGGKLIWQVDDVESLLVAWKAVPEGEANLIESALILGFMETMNRAPYANTGPPRKGVAPIFL
ncbi:hypothetical protein ACX3O0_06740 [Homoserinimonas sp. A447]